MVEWLKGGQRARDCGWGGDREPDKGQAKLTASVVLVFPKNYRKSLMNFKLPRF